MAGRQIATIRTTHRQAEEPQRSANDAENHLARKPQGKRTGLCKLRVHLKRGSA